MPDGIPDRIITTAGKPAVAVFFDVPDYDEPVGPKQASYAITDVIDLWAPLVTPETVSAEEFDDVTRRYPVVADLASRTQPRITGFQPKDSPGCLVVPYREGHGPPRRHYIDDSRWFRAVGLTALQPITSEELQKLVPDRGTDLHIGRPPLKDWCFMYVVNGFVTDPVRGRVSVPQEKKTTIRAATKWEAEQRAAKIASDEGAIWASPVREGRC